MSKVISIAVGDRIQIEGVGEVELVVVTPEQPKEEKHPLVGKWVRYWLEKWENAPFYNKWFQIESVEIINTTRGTEWQVYVNDKKEFPDGTRNEVWKGINEKSCCLDLSNPCDFDCNMPEAINPKYKVGDEVVVVGTGESFSRYKEAFWFLGLKNKQENKSFVNGTKAQVIGVSKHKNQEFYDCNMYAIRDEQGNECVIGEEGIKLAGIDKQEWLAASSRLFDSWMKISGGYVPKEREKTCAVKYSRDEERLVIDWWLASIFGYFNFTTTKQAEQFLRENEKDLLTYFHQV
jgi:hypothetical protein